MILSKFKSQLIQKNILEKMFTKVETQMTSNVLEMRARKFFLFRVCLKIVTHKTFNIFIVICIIGNAVVLALDRYPNNPGEEQVLEYINLAFFTVFGIELILKQMGLGFRYYFRDKFNWFDSLVVFVSMIDITLQYTNISKTSYYLTILQFKELVVVQSQL